MRKVISCKSDEGRALIIKAMRFASNAHEKVNQTRKYTGEPYITHPMIVSETIKKYYDDAEMIAAALLHDTVEDTEVTIEDIEREFSYHVTRWVDQLTDVSKPSDGNRKIRKEIDRRHTAAADLEAKLIKLSDFLDNTENIVKHDQKFAVIYMEEKTLALQAMIEKTPEIIETELFEKLKEFIDDYYGCETIFQSSTIKK